MRHGTHVRGHRRKIPGGGYTTVRPHKRTVDAAIAPIYRSAPRRLISRSAHNFSDPFLSTALQEAVTISSAAWPALAPLLGTSLAMYERRDIISKGVETLFSDQATEQKIERIKTLLQEQAKEEVVSVCAEKITGIVFSSSYILRELGIQDRPLVQQRLKNFTQRSLEELIETYG